MFFGQRIEGGSDPHGIETLIRFRAVSVTTLSMIYPDIGRRRRCHGRL